MAIVRTLRQRDRPAGRGGLHLCLQPDRRRMNELRPRLQNHRSGFAKHPSESWKFMIDSNAEEYRSRWGARASNPLEGAQASSVGSTPASSAFLCLAVSGGIQKSVKIGHKLRDQGYRGAPTIDDQDPPYRRTPRRARQGQDCGSNGDHLPASSPVLYPCAQNCVALAEESATQARGSNHRHNEIASLVVETSSP